MTKPVTFWGELDYDSACLNGRRCDKVSDMHGCTIDPVYFTLQVFADEDCQIHFWCARHVNEFVNGAQRIADALQPPRTVAETRLNLNITIQAGGTEADYLKMALWARRVARIVAADHVTGDDPREEPGRTVVTIEDRP